MNAKQRDKRLLTEFQAMKEISTRNALFTFTCGTLSDSEAISYMHSDFSSSLIEDNYYTLFKPHEFEERYKDKIPEKYLIHYTCTGLAWHAGAPEPKRVSDHRMLVIYGWKFPTEPPLLIWLTEIWHPNIYGPRVCLVDHHFAMNVLLADLVIEVGRLIQYQRYNLNSPLNGEAALWTMQNMQDLPIDERDLLSAQDQHFILKSRRMEHMPADESDDHGIEIL